MYLIVSVTDWRDLTGHPARPQDQPRYRSPNPVRVVSHPSLCVTQRGEPLTKQVSEVVVLADVTNIPAVTVSVPINAHFHIGAFVVTMQVFESANGGAPDAGAVQTGLTLVELNCCCVAHACNYTRTRRNVNT